jgi:hypothetical protein
MSEHPRHDPWSTYRSRRRWFFGAIFGGPLFLPLLLRPVSDALGSEKAALMALITLWFVGVSVAYARRRAFACPKCTRPFDGIRLLHPFSTKCSYCRTEAGTSTTVIASPGAPRSGA